MILENQLVQTGLKRDGSSARHDLLTGPHGAAAFLAGILDRLRVLIENHAPIGYEDHTGFHFGQGPR
jgi:hypothetical protein